MKKLLALILAAALALSLVACGGGGGVEDNNTPSGGNGDTTSTDTPSGVEDSTTSMTKEEMETNAVAVSDIEAFTETILSRTEYQDDAFRHYDYMEIYAIQTKYAENPLAFIKNYTNKPYYITGYVGNINSERISLKIIPTDIANRDAQIYIYPSDEDELLNIKKDELITIMGILVEREGENSDNQKYKYICFESAYIV